MADVPVLVQQDLLPLMEYVDVAAASFKTEPVFLNVLKDSPVSTVYVPPVLETVLNVQELLIHAHLVAVDSS
jgi:hypothetical protein